MEQLNKIRNFVVISHIDHGKSTLADRMLELTQTIEKRKMREQFLDRMELERERGITIKMQPVRMLWHSNRGITQNETQNNAEDFLYGELTYKIRGILFQVRKKIGLGHKEQVYHNALEIEFKNIGLKFESKKNIPILYEGKNIGAYQPDFVIENEVLLELKALPEIGKPQIEQLWSYLKGCDYKLALLVNFGSKDLEIKRVVYDKVRFLRNSASCQRESAGVADQINNDYVLNLIDTPGHIDFSYEVSRSLRAVEGAVLLVDAAQGVQAQTFSNLEMARELGLKIIPVLNKIDLPNARIEETKKEIIQLVGCKPEEILKVSAKTGQGVLELLEAIVERVPAPLASSTAGGKTLGVLSLTPSVKEPAVFPAEGARALIFDFSYSVHQGVIAYVRVFEGEFKKGDELLLINAEEKFKARQVGLFKPELKESEKLGAGEIGYVITNIKSPGLVRVGDTILNSKFEIRNSKLLALEGYKEPKPMIWANFYPTSTRRGSSRRGGPESQNNFDELKSALEKLHLSDSSFSFQEEPLSSQGGLGRGFKLGFLGLLHLEIISERLKREFGLKVIAASPTVAYRILLKDGKEEIIYSAASFPEEHKIKSVFETWVKAEILTSSENLGSILKLLQDYEAEIGETSEFGSHRLLLKAQMPLRELMRNFFDALKNVSSGFASLNYELAGERPADVLKLEILVAENPVSAFSKIVPRFRLETEAEKIVEKLKAVLPRELFSVKIQARARGRILASRTLPALRKHVTGNLYGGDRTRKMKLWQKQKKGKKRLEARGKVEIPQEVFLKMIQG